MKNGKILDNQLPMILVTCSHESIQGENSTGIGGMKPGNMGKSDQLPCGCVRVSNVKAAIA
jgi:hypothetical protein